MEKQIWLVILGFASGWYALALAYVDSANKSITVKVKREFQYTWEENGLGFDEEKADAFFNIQQLLTNRMAITIDNDTNIMGSGLMALASANHVPQGVFNSPTSRGHSNDYSDGPGAGGGALGPVYICGWLGGMGGQPLMFEKDDYY